MWCREVLRGLKPGARASFSGLVLTVSACAAAAILSLPFAARATAESSGLASTQAYPESAQAAALPVEPAPPADAETLYRQGYFLEAAKIAAKRGDAPSLALAARATLMHAGYIATGEAAIDELKSGEALAQAAVDKDPSVVEGLLQLVIALGYLSREEGYMKAHSDGYAREAHKLIRKAIALAPDMGWARAAEGGWNAEIVANGGPFAASLIYGASRRKAIDAFDKAIALDPGNPTIRIEYVKALIRMEPKHPDLDTVRDELRAALKTPAADAAGRLIQAQGKTLLAALDADQPDALIGVVKKLTPFEN